MVLRLMSLVALVGCAEPELDRIDAIPTRELDAIDGCFDGKDSDGDNLVDCHDPDCALECAPSNLAPYQTTVSIAPAAPTTDDDLVCSAASEDPDGDPVEHAFSWVLGGEERATGATLPAAMTWGYDTWTCVAVPTDGELEGDPGEAAVEVQAADQCKAVSLDGGGQVVVPRFAGQDLVGTDFTIDVWVRLSGSYAALTQPILTSDIQDDGSGWRLALVGPVGERALSFQTGAGADRQLVESRALVPEQRWTHLAVSYDATLGELSTWIDGVRVGDGLLPAPVSGASRGDLVIGADGGAALGAELDELRISSVDRYGTDDFTSRIWFEPDGDTLGLWHFDEGRSTTAGNESGPDGFLSGGTWSAYSACDAWI